MHDEKYIVIKRDDPMVTVDSEGWMVASSAIQVIPDAVVIRTQDVFAGSGLRAYRDSMRAHLELLERLLGRWEVFNALPGIKGEMEQEVANLERAIDYFTQVAQEAEDRFWRGETKVPD